MKNVEGKGRERVPEKPGLNEEKRSFDEIVSQVPCGIYQTVIDDPCTIVYANKYYYSLFGYSEDEAKEKGFHAHQFVIYPPDFERVKAEVIRHISEGNYEFEIVAREIHKSGKLIYILSTCKYDPSTELIAAAAIDITRRKEMEERLSISEEAYRSVARKSGKLVLFYDIQQKRLYKPVNDDMPFNSEKFDEDVPDSVVKRGDIASESVQAYLDFFHAMQRGEKEGSAVLHMLGGNGEFAWYHGDFSMTYRKNGDPLQAIVSFMNITEQREKELAYEKWRQTISELPQESMMLFEYNLTQDQYGRQEGGLMPKISSKMPKSFNDRTSFTAGKIIFPEDRRRYTEFVNRENLLSRYYSGEHEIQMEFRLIRSKGIYHWVNLSIQMVPYPDSSDIKAFLLYQDIDKRKNKEILLQLKSEIDPLTGVLNRGALKEKMSKLMEKSNSLHQLAVIILDIDHFKQINDQFGHMTGDKVLVEASKNLHLLLRPVDLIGRLGGDEFMLCLKDIPYEEVIIRRVQLISKIIRSHLGANVAVTASIGVAICPRDGTTFEELYKKADLALYKAKDQGRNCYVFYSSEIAEDDWKPRITPIDKKN